MFNATPLEKLYHRKTAAHIFSGAPTATSLEPLERCVSIDVKRESSKAPARVGKMDKLFYHSTEKLLALGSCWDRENQYSFK